MKHDVTHVNDDKCQTCAQCIGQWDVETGTQYFYCTLGLMGIQPCKSFSREPGVEG